MLSLRLCILKGSLNKLWISFKHNLQNCSIDYRQNIDVLFVVSSLERSAKSNSSATDERGLIDVNHVQVIQCVRKPRSDLQVRK